MNSFTVKNHGSVSEIGQALALAGGMVVVETGSIGDGASQVVIRRGSHVDYGTQVATYRHEVAAFATSEGYASVIGYYDADNQRWLATVTLPPGVEWTEREVERFLDGHGWDRLATPEEQAANREARLAREARQAAREEARRPQREAEQATRLARTATLEAEYQPLYQSALGKLRRNASGQLHGGDLHLLGYYYELAVERGNLDAAGHTPEQARAVLRQAAETGSLSTRVYA